MFLQVITRTFGKRPAMLARNAESLAAQTDPDFSHTIVMDDQARGCEWANRNLATVPATCEYVWVLDDDDLCCRPGLVAELKEIVRKEQPEVIMLRAYHGEFGTLPSDANWQKEPVLCNVGWSNAVIRADVWNRHREQITDVYAADYYFLVYLWHVALRWYWHDVTAAYYPQRSIGAAEDAR